METGTQAPSWVVAPNASKIENPLENLPVTGENVPQTAPPPEKSQFKFDSNDPLGFFGLSASFTQAELRKAYRKAAMQTHPDIHGAGSTTDFQRLNEMHRQLKEQLATQTGGGGNEATVTPELTTDVPSAMPETFPTINSENALIIFQQTDIGVALAELKKHLDTTDTKLITPDALQKLDKEGGFTWKQCLVAITLLSLDAIFNEGRGLASFLEDYFENVVNFKIMPPVLKAFGISEEDIEALIESKDKADTAIFKLQPEIIETVFGSMTKKQRQEAVNHLSPDEQFDLLFSQNKKDPYRRLSTVQINDLFNDRTLESSFIEMIRASLIKQGRIKS